MSYVGPMPNVSIFCGPVLEISMGGGDLLDIPIMDDLNSMDEPCSDKRACTFTTIHYFDSEPNTLQVKSPS